MKRREATERIETIVARAIAGAEYAGLCDVVWVFGSYAAGALNVNDVDLVIEHRYSERLHDDAKHALHNGGNPCRGLDRELRGSWRNMKISYGKSAKESLERQRRVTCILIWRRGEPLTTAQERLAAIKVNPEAGTAPREHVIPELVGFEKKLPIAARRRVEELVASGHVIARRFQLPVEEPRDERTGWIIASRWAATNSRRRAALALAALIEREDDSGRAWTGSGGDHGAIRSFDMTLLGFLGADQVGRAAEALGDRVKRAIVVLNDTSRSANYEAIDLRPGPGVG